MYYKFPDFMRNEDRVSFCRHFLQLQKKLLNSKGIIFKIIKSIKL